MNNRAVNLLSEYDIEVIRTWKGRGAFCVETESGLMILKEYLGKEGKVPFLEEMLKHLQEQGDYQVEQILRSKNDEYLVQDFEHSFYILKTFFPGKELDYQNIEEVVKAVKRLAFLHIALEKTYYDFQKKQICLNDVPKFDLLEECEKHNRELKRAKQFLHRKGQKTNFELFLLDEYDYFYEMAINTVKEIAYYKELFAGKVNKFFCHGDYQYHNILTNDNMIYIINFEKCIIDNPVRDLYLFIRKILEKSRWSVAVGRTVIEAYEEIYPLSMESKLNLYYRFAYPEKFWKIVNFYYNTGKTWIPGKNMEKLKKLIDQEEDRRNFLNQFLKL